MLIPKENEKDLHEVPKSVLDELEVIPVDHMDEVLKHALVLEDREAFFRKLRGAVATDLSIELPATH
jgi:ATP-dependent Lon protease